MKKVSIIFVFIVLAIYLATTFNSSKTAKMDAFDAVDTRLSELFKDGDVSVFHVDDPEEDVHVDVYIVKPSEDRPFYMFITSGMSSFKMAPHKSCKNCNYGELVLYMPKDWKLPSSINTPNAQTWPVTYLRSLVYYAYYSGNWLWSPHTIGADETTFPGTKFMGAVLLPYEFAPKGLSPLRFKDGEIHFLTLIPLYKEEVDYKLKINDSDPLIKKLKAAKVLPVVDVNRVNVCAKGCK
ncbi:hypothetical protein Dip510_001303 [Elusimicrobium posterum]|uniref:suppressor of fused domain protein n=1 Tax=Elusimicrobium posterum TaxID=3116653 RepID=UPI003C796908